MRIVAQSENWYVLQISEELGRVFDADRGRVFAPMSLVAILARGGWSEFKGDERTVVQALSAARDVTPDRADQQPLRGAATPA